MPLNNYLLRWMAVAGALVVSAVLLQAQGEQERPLYLNPQAPVEARADDLLQG